MKFLISDTFIWALVWIFLAFQILILPMKGTEKILTVRSRGSNRCVKSWNLIFFASENFPRIKAITFFVCIKHLTLTFFSYCPLKVAKFQGLFSKKAKEVTIYQLFQWRAEKLTDSVFHFRWEKYSFWDLNTFTRVCQKFVIKLYSDTPWPLPTVLTTLKVHEI